jgi:hypothetical protein
MGNGFEKRQLIKGLFADEFNNLFLSINDPVGGTPTKQRIISLTPSGILRFDVDAGENWWGVVGVEGGRILGSGGGSPLRSTADGAPLFDVPYMTCVATAQGTGLPWNVVPGMEHEISRDETAFSIAAGDARWTLPGTHSVACAQAGAWGCTDGFGLSPAVSNGEIFYLDRSGLPDAGQPLGMIAVAVDGGTLWVVPPVPTYEDPVAATSAHVFTQWGRVLDARSGQLVAHVPASDHSLFIVGDDATYWTIGFIDYPDGGESPSFLAQRATATGLPLWSGQPSGRHLQLTRAGNVIAESPRELVQSGRAQSDNWTCSLGAQAAYFEGHSWGFPTFGLLGQGHYFRVSESSGSGVNIRYQVQSFALPGISLADHGWVTFGGNPGRTNHPR